MSSNEFILGVTACQIAVPPGASAGVYVTNDSKQGALTLKYYSGGTLEIQGCANGTTMAPADLATLGLNKGYILGTTEAISIDGPARFYLLATGTTAVACLLKGLTTPGAGF